MKLKSIVGAAAALAVAGALAIAPAAWGDDSPPEEIVPTVVEEAVTDVPEATPTEEVPIEETVVEEVPEAPSFAPQSKPEKPPKEDDPPKKVLVCKYVSKPGVNESLKPGKNPIEVNSNSVGHDWPEGTFPFSWTDAQERSEVIGYADSGATCPEPDIDYVTVAWLVPGGAGSIWDPHQEYVTSTETDEPNLHALDEYPFEGCSYYQIDVYFDTEVTQELIAGAVLYGPDNPEEDLIPGGAGVAWKFVETEGCQPDPIVTWLGDPKVKDLCETENDHYGLPEAGPGVTVVRDGLGFVATLETGYVWPEELPEGWTEGEGNLFFAFDPEDFTDVNCEEVVPVPALFEAEPTPPTCEADGSFDVTGEFPNVTVTVSPEYDGPGTYLIEAETDEDYEFPDGSTYKSIEVTVLGQLVTQSEDPEAPCYEAPPVPEEPETPVGLALTGVTTGPLGLAAVALLLGGVITVLLVRLRKLV